MLCFYMYSFSQKAFPGAEGYGDNRGAYAGSSTPKILIVDNLDPGDFGDEASGRGTFLWCLNRPYPRIVLFEVGGVIDYSSRDKSIIIGESYLTVAGQTAPGVGITIVGTYLQVDYPSTNENRGIHDIIIQHIRVRTGDNLGGTPFNDRDAFSIFTGHVMIDHCSFSWSMDGITDLTRCHNITLSNCIFSEPLHLSHHFRETGEHEPEAHGFAMLITDVYNMTLKNNLFAYSMERNPFTRADSIVIINNMMYNGLGYKMGAAYHGDSYSKIHSSYIGNVVLRTQSTTNGMSKLAAIIESNVSPDSKLYFEDNICTQSIENPSIPEVDKIRIVDPDLKLATSSPLSLEGYNILPASLVEDYIVTNVGAKPFEREPIDERVVTNVHNRVGEIINSPGPLPARAYNFGVYVTGSTKGYMENGYDWSSSPRSFTINGTTVQLNQDCNSLQDVFDHINPQLPAGVESFLLSGGTFIGFRTTQTGSDKSLTVSGSGLTEFGIPEGTYYGSDGVGGLPSYPLETRTLSSINGYPEADPHGDDNSNGFTNLEEWIYAMGTGALALLGNETIPQGPSEFCQGTESTDYATIGDSQANIYSWVVSPQSAGTILGTGKAITVNWNPLFSGNCDLYFYAYGSNLSAVSSPIDIYVSPKPPAPDIPEGPDSLFQNSPDTEYTVIDMEEADEYDWKISPSAAGTLDPLFNTCSIRWDEFFFGNAYLSVRAKNECEYGYYSDSLLIKVNEVELGYGIINIFTPNGDGFNDYWSIPFVRDFPNATIKIFDRNNKLLIEYKGSDSSWNGTVNGELVPMGNYLYVIELGGGKQPIKGHVTVLR